MELRSAYWDDFSSKNAFMEFIETIFGANFRRWDQAGYWDDCYRPFSYFEDGKIVSSVCLYSLDMMVQGRLRRVAQISGVGTVPASRRKGLNRELTEIAMNWASAGHDFIFLFSSEEGLPYYERTGFHAISENRVRIRAPRCQKVSRIDSLTIEDKGVLQKVFDLASDRVPVSDVLGILSPKLLMFHVLYTLKNCIYYVPQLDAVVFYKRKDGCLKVFDILSRREIPFGEIYPFIADESDQEVEFLFMTDKLGLDEFETVENRENSVFVHGAFPFQDGCFQFPFTAQA
jgi:GNAT superfamily N-acetyltransferase